MTINESGEFVRERNVSEEEKDKVGHINERGEFIRGQDAPKIFEGDAKEKPKDDKLPVELL